MYRIKQGFDFYPRSPCGERHWAQNAALAWAEFLSTLSLRRATPKIMINGEANKFLSTLSLRRATISTSSWSLTRMISIHALLAESDAFCNHPCQYNGNFYPRSPCGERLLLLIVRERARVISIHALLAESDASRRAISAQSGAFLSTLSLRRATAATMVE